MKSKELNSADEQLSALIDGEVPARELPMLIAGVNHDQGRRDTLEVFSMIGGAMRAGKDDVLAVGLANRINAALDGEDNHQVRLGFANRRVIKPLAGVAIAASVAALAIVNLPGSGVSTDSDSVDIIANTPSSYTVPPEIGTTSSEPRVSVRLANYLIDHSEFSPSPVRRNVLYEIIGQEEAITGGARARDSEKQREEENSGE